MQAPPPEGGSIWCLGEAPARACARGEPDCAGGLSARLGTTAAVAASACWCSRTSDFSACRNRGAPGSACCLCLRVDPDQPFLACRNQTHTTASMACLSSNLSACRPIGRWPTPSWQCTHRLRRCCLMLPEEETPCRSRAHSLMATLPMCSRPLLRWPHMPPSGERGGTAGTASKTALSSMLHLVPATAGVEDPTARHLALGLGCSQALLPDILLMARERCALHVPALESGYCVSCWPVRPHHQCKPRRPHQAATGTLQAASQQLHPTQLSATTAVKPDVRQLLKGPVTAQHVLESGVGAPLTCACQGRQAESLGCAEVAPAPPHMKSCMTCMGCQQQSSTSTCCVHGPHAATCSSVFQGQHFFLC